MSASGHGYTVGAQCDLCGSPLAWDDGWSVCPFGCGFIAARCRACGGLRAARLAEREHKCAHARKSRLKRANNRLVLRYAMAKRWQRARTATQC